MDDVHVLVASPFRDIVELGKTAVDNAGDSQPMLKAAQSLVKEGQRALKRLEPLCKKHFDEYGFTFVDALKENEEITNYRSELTDLLWGFDDYTELESFDADKYAHLQARSRAAAPKMYDILTRMRLDVLPRDTAHFLSQLSPPSSPLPLASSPLQPDPLAIPRPARSSMSSSQAESLDDRMAVQHVTTQLQRLMDSPASSPPVGASRPPAPEPESAPAQQPPRPPSTNPWDPRVPQLPDDKQSRDYDICERLQTAQVPNDEESRDYHFCETGPMAQVHYDEPSGNDTSCEEMPMVLVPDHYTSFVQLPRSESPVDPSVASQISALVGRRPATSVGGGSDYDGDDRRPSLGSVYSTSSGSGFVSRRRVSKLTMAIPEDKPMEQAINVEPLAQPSHLGPWNMSPYTYSERFPAISRRLSGESAASSGGGDGHSQLIVVGVGSGPASETPPSNRSISNNFATQVEQPLTRLSPDFQPGLEFAASTIYDTGLIPVESENSDARCPGHNAPQICTISASSSFYLHKGFCEGAREVSNGDLGVKKTQKPNRRTLSRAAARCTGCLYELEMGQIELDVNKQEEGNFTKCGVGYRVRFLQKSHLPAKRVDDVLYGCVFCVHQGRTLDESDATVFFTTKELFTHLARHPRPLPAVPGICVADEVVVPEHLRNNYDLHFPNPPTVHPAHEHHDDIAGLPSGVTREQARRIYGKRLLFDRSPVLELAQGARITGIRWPSKYNGEWMFAWHDGTFAAAPTDMIKLDVPPAADIKMGGTSHVRAKAKWKFAPRDKDAGEWLKFEKNETISNISWAYPEHWCWSGTNARGKWGIFPQAFVDTNTIKELALGGVDGRASMSNEKGKTPSMLSKFSVRRSSGRPPSIAESVSSRDTAFTGFRLSSMISRGTNDSSGGGGR